MTGNALQGWPEDATEVHVSVAFTWDLPEAERLAEVWSLTGLPVKIGGPATGEAADSFVPGRYLKPGYVITSRGCNNRCWFCYVPKREDNLRELPISEGWIVLDDNLLACSEGHIADVFAMLKEQPKRAQFTGGLEAAKLTPEIAAELKALKPQRMYFAYDTPNDQGPLWRAGQMLRKVGITRESHRACCYVLIGYPRDTFEAAEIRLRETWEAGFWPFAMLYRDDEGKRSPEWITFQRHWANPWLVAAQL